MTDTSRRTYLTGLAAMTAALAGCPLRRQSGENPDASDGPGQGGAPVTAGSPERRLVSRTNREITVPGDFATIQAAVDRIPLVMRHKWSIDIESGSYDEDVIVPPFIGEWARPDQSEGVPVQITGNRDRPSDVSIGSLFANSIFGTIPIQFRGLEITRQNPYDDESTGIGIYGCSEVGLIDISFSGGNNGIHSYNSQVLLRNVDFGDRVLPGRALTVKHGGFAYENIDVPEPTSGTVGTTAYNALSGRIWIAGNRSTLSGDSLVNARGGMVWDYENQQIVRTQSAGTAEQSIENNRIRSAGELITVSEGSQRTLSGIDGGTKGDRCTLVTDGEIRIHNERGNISLSDSGDRMLGPRETLTLVYDGSEWLEV